MLYGKKIDIIRRHFIFPRTTSTLTQAISEVTEKLNISGVVDIVKTAIGIDGGKKELGNTIQMKDALRAATYLELEVSISQQSPGGELGIQLYPVDETFKKIERWRQLSERDSEIFFPENAVNAQDWYEVSNKLKELELEHGSELTDSIHGTSD